MALFAQIERGLKEGISAAAALTELKDAVAGLDEMALRLPTCRMADYHLSMLIKELKGLIRSLELGSKTDSETADYYRRNIRTRAGQLKIETDKDPALQEFLLELAA